MGYFEPYIDADGIHIPTYEDCLEYLITKYKEIFGQDVYLKEGTKDYQLLSIFAKCWDDLTALVVDDYNSRDPNYATGNSLDLLVAINGMSRRAATHSTVTLALTGTASTVIPAGSTAIDVNGYIWSTDEACTLDANGTGSVGATCDTAGAVAAPIGTINSIYVMQSGWTGVNNTVAATTGLDTETDAEMRNRRNLMTARMNNGGYDALSRALIEVDGVTKSDVVVNDTGSTDANSIPAHSICCLVQGGENADIAEAIWKAKAPGIGLYGSTSVTYVDRNGHSNTIKFTRPTEKAIDVTVTITALAGYDSSRCADMINSALVQAVSEMKIGEAYSVSTAYRDIYNAFAGTTCPFVISSVTAGAHGSSQGTSVPCNYNQIITLTDSNITITANT